MSETFLVLRRIDRDVIINVYRCLCNVQVNLSDFNETSVLSTGCRKKYSNIKFHENSFQRERSSMQTDGRADVTKLIVVFRNSANAPNDCTFCSHCMLCIVRTSEQHSGFCSVQRKMVLLSR